MDMETAARLSLLQSLIEHMLAEKWSRHPGGKEAVAVLKESVMRSLDGHCRFTRPVSEEEREDFLVNVRTIGEAFFSRVDSFRAQLAAHSAIRSLNLGKSDDA